jgi:hypothetical protein
MQSMAAWQGSARHVVNAEQGTLARRCKAVEVTWAGQCKAPMLGSARHVGKSVYGS